ncbi:MAG: PolC-type DNA polymerase III, partial [Thermodesulfobacteriota bacterium]
MKRSASMPCPASFVAVDIETTGLSYKRGDRIVELAAVAVDSGEAVSEFHSLIKTQKRISPSAFSVHGITAETLSGAPGPEKVFSAFKRFVGTIPLVAHNATFDMGFLRYEYARLGLGFSHKYFCSLRLGRRLLPQLPSYSLEALYPHLFSALPKGI